MGSSPSQPQPRQDTSISLMNGNGITGPPTPYTRMLQRSVTAAAPRAGAAQRDWISAMMMSALKITADSTLAGECSRMMFSASSCG